ncbi:hypothetical protein [Pontibacter liquoris]|uniref:hypothetical protein n=1 Tax=Pontibacter liquoris TaxID=2905677 RepID=UPI001FA79639|nr:hypothetical protein [Pontibacter liquoris]
MNSRAIEQIKRVMLTAAFLNLCMAGAYAQTAERHVKQFPPIGNKPLDLKYLGRDSSSVLERINKYGVASRYLTQQKEVNVRQKTEKLQSQMPVMQPDSSIKFHILAAVPDTTIQYHMRVKKAE